MNLTFDGYCRSYCPTCKRMQNFGVKNGRAQCVHCLIKKMPIRFCTYCQTMNAVKVKEGWLCTKCKTRSMN